MVKKKVVEMLLRGKEFVLSKKKGLAVASGVALLGVAGVGVATVVGSGSSVESVVASGNKAALSVSKVVASVDKLDTKDKKEVTKEKDKKEDTKDKNKETDKVKEISEKDKNSGSNSKTEDTTKETQKDLASEETLIASNSSDSYQSSESDWGNQVIQTSNSNESVSYTPVHTHSWTPVTETVWHDEVGHWEDVVVTPAWTEEVPVYEQEEVAICNGCGMDITSEVISGRSPHLEENLFNGNPACGAWHSEWRQVQTGTNVIEHPAVTEKQWVVDQASWSETVTTGYICSCGASK